MNYRNLILISLISALAAQCKSDDEFVSPGIKKAAADIKDANEKENPSTEKPGSEIGNGKNGKDPVDGKVIPDPSTPPVSPDPTETDLPPVEKPMEMVTRSEGCGASNQLADGAIEFQQDKFKRKYIIRKPVGYAADKAWPLVLALHPNGSNTGFWDGTTGDRAIRKMFGDKAIIVVAQARAGDWRGDLPTELAYFETIMTNVKSKLCVDTKRIFSMGFSGGGSFSGVLGCMRKDIRAFASGGGVQYFDEKLCVGKPAAWITIGDEEAVPDRIAYREYWRKFNDCSEQKTKSEPATCSIYSCKNPDRLTEFCSHPGGHAWPSFGSEAAWTFFTRFQ
ncbi:MAG: hypothetical protein EOP10_09015 [Proteobacteria bacterium]|nr:MAG: hypothetical protein EOP10_09015 [Pseudomonadota bacterium]